MVVLCGTVRVCSLPAVPFSPCLADGAPAMAAYTGKHAGNAETKAAISALGSIGRTERSFETVITDGSMTPEQAAHLLKYNSGLGTFDADVTYGDDGLAINAKQIKLIASQDSKAGATWASW